MIQRPQNLWILLAIVAAVCTFEFPIAIGVSEEQTNVGTLLDAGSSTLLIVMTLFTVLLLGLAVLAYSNLNRQKSICWLGILMGVVLCFCYISEWRNLQYPQLSLSCFLPALIPVSLLLAWMGIKRDQQFLSKRSRH